MWGYFSFCNCYNISSIYCMFKNLFIVIGYFVDNFFMWFFFKLIFFNFWRCYNVVVVINIFRKILI